MNFLKKWSFRILLFIVALIALVAASDNSSDVTLRFLGYESWEWPVSWWMLTAFVFGVGFGAVLNFATNTRLRMQARRASKEVTKTQKSLDQARSGSS